MDQYKGALAWPTPPEIKPQHMSSPAKITQRDRFANQSLGQQLVGEAQRGQRGGSVWRYLQARALPADLRRLLNNPDSSPAPGQGKRRGQSRHAGANHRDWHSDQQS